ncbi:NAD dependent epimerase/dehydratase family protein, partial [Yersinia pestis PY-88]
MWLFMPPGEPGHGEPAV